MKVGLKKQLLQAQKELIEFRLKAKQMLYTLCHPEQRALLSIEATDSEGRINGITAAELVTIVKLTEGTGEQVYLSASGKTVTFLAEKKPSVSVSSL